MATALTEIRYRRSSYLDEVRQNELLNARMQLQEIHETLAGRHEPLTPDEKQRFLEISHGIAANLRKNLGIIKGEIETGARE